MGKAENKKKKFIRVRSYLTRPRKFQKNIIKIKKVKKKKKNIIPALFLAKTEWERSRMSKQKISF